MIKLIALILEVSAVSLTHDLAAAWPGALSSSSSYCAPCMDRQTFSIRAILHGSPRDPFWQQVKGSAQAAAVDLGVDLEVLLYGDDDIIQPPSNQMVEAIENIVQQYSSSSVSASARRPDALLVTTPTEQVQEAVAKALEAGLPVFGLNTGSNYWMSTAYSEDDDLTDSGESENNVLAWVGADDYAIGRMAAQAFLKQNVDRPIRKALFVHRQQAERSATGMDDEQFRGYKETILEHQSLMSHLDTVLDHNVLAGTVQQVVLDNNNNNSDLLPSDEELASIFEGCPFDAIFWNGPNVTLVSEWIHKYECTNLTLLGGLVVESDSHVSGLPQAVQDGRLLFGISEQAHVQGHLPVVLATLYLTTGQVPAPSFEEESGIFLAHHTLWDKSNVASMPSASSSPRPSCPNDTSPCSTSSTELPALRTGKTRSPCSSLRVSTCQDASSSPPRTIGFVIFDEDAVDPLYTAAIASAAKAAAQDFKVKLQFLPTNTYSMSLPLEDGTSWSMIFEEEEEQEEEQEPEKSVFFKRNINKNSSMYGEHLDSSSSSSPRTPSLWEACGQGNLVDGLVVALPLQAHFYPPLAQQRYVRFNPYHYYFAVIQRCLENGIPVIAVRGNFEESSPMEKSFAIRHQVRPNFYAAGFKAGQEFARRIREDNDTNKDDANELPSTSSALSEHKVWCLYTTVSAHACVGLQDALYWANDRAMSTNETNVLRYMDHLHSEGGRNSYFRAILKAELLEAYQDGSSNTASVQLFLTDTVLLPIVQELDRAITDRLTIGVIGATEEVYAQMDAGVIQFALDPQWYSEGYLPVALLAQEDAQLENEAIETAPTLLRSPPQLMERTCQANLFPVCPITLGSADGDLDNGNTGNSKASSALIHASAKRRAWLAVAGTVASVLFV